MAAARAGQMLWDECVASVRYRYSGTATGELPGPIGETFVYAEHEGFPFHLHGRVPFTLYDVAKAVRCYQYQSCEHPGWEGSEAKAFTDALVSAYLSAQPEYDAAEWGPPQACYAKAAT